MKINLVFIEVQGAREAFGSLRFAFELHGKTVGDLIDEMVKRYGSKSERVFLKDGHYRGNLQIISNWKNYILPEKINESVISEGDTIIFAPLVDGG
jgi:molybdopterin converting factor small subunit